MPFDYPGDYLLRFDGIDVIRFRELVATPRGGRPARDAAALTNSGPGTVEAHRVSGVNAAGDLLLHRWQRSSVSAGAPSKVVIVAPSPPGSPTSRWLLRNARPVKSATTPGAAPPTGGAIRVESLTIVHEGMQRVP